MVRSPDGDTKNEDADDGDERHEWSEILNREIMMKVLKGGDAEPNDESVQCGIGDAVLASVSWSIGELKDGALPLATSSPTLVDSELIVVGDGIALPCLELSARFLREGETALVYSSSRFAFASKGDSRRGLPPDADLFLKVTVERVTKAADVERDMLLQLELVERRKRMGNEEFKREGGGDLKVSKELSKSFRFRYRYRFRVADSKLIRI